MESEAAGSAFDMMIPFYFKLLTLGVASMVIAAPSINVPRAPSAFVHPGVLLNATQLNFMKSMVASNTAPWSTTYNLMMTNSLASLDRSASPVVMVECGSYSNPDVGCTAERQDSIAAYTMSLAWYITGQTKYASKAIEYMDAWSAVVTGHNNSNAPLQAGWVGSMWARTAEIIRYTDAGWSTSQVSQFENMLKEAYLPEVIVGATNYNGNWELGRLSLSHRSTFSSV